MKKLSYLLVAVLAALMVMPSALNAQDKKKKKKAKKEFVWDWNHEKSGNETVDSYLMACDTLWNDITKYQENITSYVMKDDTLKKDDKIYLITHMETADGKSVLTKGAANWQLVESISTGMAIVANSVQIGAQTASATMALPSLGFKALSYAKYVKAGPMIIGKAGKEIKDIVVMRKEQMRKWRSIRKDAIEDAVDPAVLFPDMDKASLEKMAKSYFIKEIKPEDTGYNEVNTVFVQRSQEEIDAAGKDFAAGVVYKEVEAERAGQTFDRMDEEEYIKQLEAEMA